MKPQTQGKPIRKCETSAVVHASMMQGPAATRTHTDFSFLRAWHTDKNIHNPGRCSSKYPECIGICIITISQQKQPVYYRGYQDIHKGITEKISNLTSILSYSTENRASVGLDRPAPKGAKQVSATERWTWQGQTMCLNVDFKLKQYCIKNFRLATSLVT